MQRFILSTFLCVWSLCGVSLVGAQAPIDGKAWEGESDEMVRFAASQEQLAAESCRDASRAKIFSRNAVALWKLLLKRNAAGPLAAEATSGIGNCLERAEGAEPAIAFCRETLGKLPGAFPDLRFRLARLLVQRYKTHPKQGDLDEAIHLLTDLRLPRVQPVIHFVRAEALVAKREFARALVDYERITKEYPDDDLTPLSLYEMGRVLLVQGIPSGAEKWFREFLRRGKDRKSPAWTDAWLRRGVRLGLANSLFAQEEYKLALGVYQALAGEREYAQKDFAQLRHAECLAGLGQSAQAASLAEKLLDHPELGSRARYLAARWWIEGNDPERARSILKHGDRTWMDFTPEESSLEIQARIRQAEKWFRNQQWEQAAGEFQAIAEIAEDDAVREFAYRHAGVSLFHLADVPLFQPERWHKAHTVLTEQLRIAPQGIFASHSYFLLGVVESRLADVALPREAADHASKARVAFAEGLAAARTAGDEKLVLNILTQAGAILERQGQAKPAETYYQQILEEKTVSPQQRFDAHEAIARVCLKSDTPRYAKAIEHLSVVASLPDDAPGFDRTRTERVLFVLGQCHRALDQSEKALACFQKVARTAQAPAKVARSLYEVGCCEEKLGNEKRSFDVWYDLRTRFAEPELLQAIELERVREMDRKLQDGLKRRLKRLGL